MKRKVAAGIAWLDDIINNRFRFRVPSGPTDVTMTVSDTPYLYKSIADLEEDENHNNVLMAYEKLNLLKVNISKDYKRHHYYVHP